MIDWVLSLFNLEGVAFDAAGGWELRAGTEYSSAVVVFGAVALVVLVWQIYRRERGTTTPRSRLALGLLRIIALAVLVAALLQPELVVFRSELKKSFVLILADKSDSMKLVDRYRDDRLVARLSRAAGLAPDAASGAAPRGVPRDAMPDPVSPDVARRLRSLSRAEIANRILARPEYALAPRLAESCRVRQFVFAAGLEPAGAPERSAAATTPPAGAGTARPAPLVIRPDGPVTQIGDAIRNAIDELRGQRIAAMVVLSDWCSNSGLPPVEATRYALTPDATFPIFAVGVGDPAEQRDVIVSSVSANSVAFLNDPPLFNVVIEHAGYEDREVPLQLRIGDDVAARKTITLKADQSYYTITHRPTKKGVTRYTVIVPPQDDELSARNNAVEHTVTVKDDKVRVLLVAGWPSWEWRYLKTALARDKTVAVSVWLQSADTDWVMAGGTQLNQLPLNKKEFVDSFDVVVLLGASAGALSDEQMENLRSFVADFGGGLIFQASHVVETEAFAKTPLALALPVELQPPDGFPPDREATHAFKPRITPAGWASPITKLIEDPHQNRDTWANLPGFFWFHPVRRVKPAARVLAEHPEEKTERGPLPLFVEQRYGAGKVFFSATDETWRWRYILGDEYFYRFWRQAIGLMASNKLLGAAKRLTLSVARNSYVVGQKVEIEAKLLDEMLQPSRQPSLDATLDLPGGRTQRLRLSLADPSQGIYRGSVIAHKVGDHAVWMTAPDSGKREVAPFAVTMSTLESQSRRLDTQTMRAVAKKTNGRAFLIDEIDRIPNLIRSESANILTEDPTPIWDSWGFLILFAVPLAIEWWVRKRRLLT
jgi:hypothetical protein